MTQKKLFDFPVGYNDFHPNVTINFQLNRWYSLGYFKLEDIETVAPRIKDLDDWKRELLFLAEKAINNKELLRAAFYYRGAEFFTSPSDPDKLKLYDKFVELFYSTFDKIFEQYDIPYNNSFLPAYRFSPEKQQIGTIIIHGGFDSFIEEFFSLGAIFRNLGYDVILFEGPGQGKVLKEYNLPLIPEWEKPTSALLDYFGLEDVSLIGVSLGGYLALRAAAFDQRIQRVVAYDVIYDIYENSMARRNIVQRLVVWLLYTFKARRLINKITKKGIEKSLEAAWGVQHGMYITQTTTPYEFFTYYRKFSLKKVSELITQDVLLLAGEEDHGIHLKMFYKQKQALTNARSITGRIFTHEEHAANHCQVGNLSLVFQVILDWIASKQ